MDCLYCLYLILKQEREGNSLMMVVRDVLQIIHAMREMVVTVETVVTTRAIIGLRVSLPLD